MESDEPDVFAAALRDGRIKKVGGRLVMTRYTPANCPHCEYDRRFPETAGGGWIYPGNNGPIGACPMCNPDGKHPRS